MSYHIISIDAETSSITASRGMLIADSPMGRRSIPMEDVAAVIVTSFKCTLTGNFLIEAAKLRMGVILCDSYRPACLVLPVDRATDTLLTRQLARMPAQLKKRLWQKTVDAKCYNQYQVARTWDASHPSLVKMERLLGSSKESKEGETARLYWSVFGDTFAGGTFVRNRNEAGTNALLNYAYAVLLALVLRYLLALGLDPSFGIFHLPRAHAAPLAYDLMEPFRPAFDANIARWLARRRESGAGGEGAPELDRETKKHLLSTLLSEVSYQDSRMPLRRAIESSIRSFRAAVTSSRVTPYEPWKISTIKWVG